MLLTHTRTMGGRLRNCRHVTKLWRQVHEYVSCGRHICGSCLKEGEARMGELGESCHVIAQPKQKGVGHTSHNSPHTRNPITMLQHTIPIRCPRHFTGIISPTLIKRQLKASDHASRICCTLVDTLKMLPTSRRVSLNTS